MPTTQAAEFDNPPQDEQSVAVNTISVRVISPTDICGH
jgi:hypothetical protein